MKPLHLTITIFTFNNCSTFCVLFLISILGSLLKWCKLHNSRIFLSYIQIHTTNENVNF